MSLTYIYMSFLRYIRHSGASFLAFASLVILAILFTTVAPVIPASFLRYIRHSGASFLAFASLVTYYCCSCYSRTSFLSFPCFFPVIPVLLSCHSREGGNPEHNSISQFLLIFYIKNRAK